MPIDDKPVRGRGASTQVRNRFQAQHYAIAEIEGVDEFVTEPGSTRYIEVFPKSIINRVDAPDIPFSWSVNPYQGCEHGCSYCYARPTHEYWGYGPGLDFERVVLLKRNAPELLRHALGRRSWRPEWISLSGNTDPYQPVERREGITRGLLQVLSDTRHPCGIITKNALVLRDMDLLVPMAEQGLVRVAISLTTLNEELRRVLEPRTSTSMARLRTIEELSRAGVPVTVMAAPMIPGLNDSELPAILKAAADAGAVSAGYTVLRTNGAVAEVFDKWLRDHYPDRAAKVRAQTAAVHGGRMQDARFGTRMKGEGVFAQAIARTFKVFSRRYFKGRTLPDLESGLFRRPADGQLDLFT